MSVIRSFALGGEVNQTLRDLFIAYRNREIYDADKGVLQYSICPYDIA